MKSIKTLLLSLVLFSCGGHISTTAAYVRIIQPENRIIHVTQYCFTDAFYGNQHCSQIIKLYFNTNVEVGNGIASENHLALYLNGRYQHPTSYGGFMLGQSWVSFEQESFEHNEFTNETTSVKLYSFNVGFAFYAMSPVEANDSVVSELLEEGQTLTIKILLCPANEEFGNNCIESQIETVTVVIDR